MCDNLASDFDLHGGISVYDAGVSGGGRVANDLNGGLRLPT